MDLIDRYVHQVGQYLPVRLREDVETELRSLLTDSLDERARLAGRPADAALAAEVLRAFGAPRDVASRYAPQPQYLIGPRLYPGYRLAVKVMLPILAGVVLLQLAVGFYQHQGEPPSISAFIRATGSFLSTALLNVGLMTLIFALVERALQRRESETATFDPASLPPVNDPDRISYFGRIFALYMIAAVALLFNFFPEWVAVVIVHNTDVRVIRLLEPAFNQYLPYLNAWWICDFALILVVLRHGRWRRPTRWAEFGLELLNAAILLAIVLGPPVSQYDAPVKLVLEVFLIIALVTAGSQLYRLLKRRAGQPWALSAGT